MYTGSLSSEREMVLSAIKYRSRMNLYPFTPLSAIKYRSRMNLYPSTPLVPLNIEAG